MLKSTAGRWKMLNCTGDSVDAMSCMLLYGKNDDVVASESMDRRGKTVEENRVKEWREVNLPLYAASKKFFMAERKK